jgi:hypothetical protein
MINIDKITEIFCIVDDFWKEFEKAKSGHVVTKECSRKRRNRSFNLSDSEVITIPLQVTRKYFTVFIKGTSPMSLFWTLATLN